MPEVLRMNSKVKVSVEDRIIDIETRLCSYFRQRNFHDLCGREAHGKQGLDALLGGLWRRECKAVKRAAVMRNIVDDPDGLPGILKELGAEQNVVERHKRQRLSDMEDRRKAASQPSRVP